MEHAIKYIRVGEGDEQTGVKPALCFRGSRVAHAVLNDETSVRAVVITLQAYDKAPPVLQGTVPYPLGRFKAHMEEFARRKGISMRARALLDAGFSAPVDLDLPPDDAPPRAAVERLAPDLPPSDPPKPAAALPIKAKAGRSAKPAPVPAPLPPKKAKKAPSVTAKPPVKVRPGLVADLAKELKITTVELRVRLRKAGLRAPYDDMKKMRKALK